MHTVRPLRLPPNQLHRFYRGGARIAGLRGSSHSDERAPEDWVGSVTTTFGSSEQGLSRLEDGRILAAAVAEDPESFLGPGRGADPALLVKLLDAGERLPVHFHPDRGFARERLGSPYGKSEAWIVVEADGDDPAVHLGLRDDVGSGHARGLGCRAGDPRDARRPQPGAGDGGRHLLRARRAAPRDR